MGWTALRDQRAWAWKAWPGLRHDVRQVYQADARGLDVVAVGVFSIHDAEGKPVGGGSAANFHLVEKDGGLLIDRLEIFSVSSNFTRLRQMLTKMPSGSEPSYQADPSSLIIKSLRMLLLVL